MGSKGVMEPENAELVSQALALFHAGKWAQAPAALRQAQDRAESAEISAALGICQVFSVGPLGLDSSIVKWDKLETTAQLLHQGNPIGWPEVAACRAWLQLLQERQSSPEQIPAALDTLVDACRQSHWFPIWVLAFRALAYYDRRQTIRDLLSRAAVSPASDSHGFELILAEAKLECAQTVSAADFMPQDVDVHDCLPLAPEVACLWHQWLLAEFAWWQDEEPETLERTIAGLLKTPAPEDDLYSLNEWDRLMSRVALLGARCALSRHALEEAEHWIEQAFRDRPMSWEGRYLEGLMAWSQGEAQSGRVYLGQSLTDNPFQSRVRFELEMLLFEDPADNKSYKSHLNETMPGVHDAVASSAVVLFRLGEETEAGKRLRQLDQTEAPYSLRLIWPGARTLRLRQGWELRAHLAEAGQNWSEAMKCWDAAQSIYSLSHEATRHDGRGKSESLVRRAHRLYLLGRHTRQDTMGESISDKTLHIEFHKELGKLSIRPLTGDAMFYRGLAAAERMPDRALADWRALLRQSTWVEMMQKVAPSRLLCLGDQLLKAKLREDAYKAYQLASVTPVAGTQERLLASELLARHPPEVAHLLQALESAESFAPDDPRWPFLRALSLLAQEPPSYERGQSLLEQARQRGLSTRLQELGELLLALVTREPDANQQLRSFLDNDEDKTAIPSTLQLGLEILCCPAGVETLLHFKEAFDADWETCPISPQEVISQHLRECCAQSDYAAALDQIQRAERIGIYIPNEWRAFLYASLAVQMARSGDFEAAKIAQQEALESLSPDQQEVEHNEGNVR